MMIIDMFPYWFDRWDDGINNVLVQNFDLLAVLHGKALFFNLVENEVMIDIFPYWFDCRDDGINMY
ncbi:hypothetical protein SLEP1_g853 [Rubroshorea leprosula]|uniref:Uncharacterized protein n=1 Tax=Rubroshorea leprosula TaxID=152421 RepID=A0AAV5HLC8_9ROSI|nr:hypothetical protein SLEP1_g853 [Rubroshorea leprosula]